MKRIGMLTSGGDCQALNAAMRGVVKTLANGKEEVEIYGFQDGYRGLIYGNFRMLTDKDFSGILTKGGTILGTSRTPFKTIQDPDPNGLNKVEAMKQNYYKLQLDCLVILGGNGTHKTANLLRKEGLNIVTLPKTIDNDLWGTDMTFGFQSAVDIATNAIDCIHTTAASHGRVFIVELMGHKVGWLTLHAGIAGGADITQPSSSVSAAPTPDPRSEAQSRLETFMNSWMSQDVNGMLACCTPSWINSHENPQREIFNIRGVNTPLSFNITYVAGSDSDDSRTITMEALMDRANGTQKNYRYEVLMLRVNGVWYVDPASLSSATEVKEEATAAPVYTLMPTNSPDPGQVLYYNPDGGSYYHADQNCSRINNKYLPLKGSFLYSQLDETAYAKLQPCSNCNAPNRN